MRKTENWTEAAAPTCLLTLLLLTGRWSSKLGNTSPANFCQCPLSASPNFVWASSRAALLAEIHSVSQTLSWLFFLLQPLCIALLILPFGSSSPQFSNMAPVIQEPQGIRCLGVDSWSWWHSLPCFAGRAGSTAHWISLAEDWHWAITVPRVLRCEDLSNRCRGYSNPCWIWGLVYRTPSEK